MPDHPTPSEMAATAGDDPAEAWAEAVMRRDVSGSWRAGWAMYRLLAGGEIPRRPRRWKLLPTVDDVMGILSDDPATVHVARHSRGGYVPTKVAHEALDMVRRRSLRSRLLAWWGRR